MPLSCVAYGCHNHNQKEIKLKIEKFWNDPYRFFFAKAVTSLLTEKSGREKVARASLEGKGR